MAGLAKEYEASGTVDQEGSLTGVEEGERKPQGKKRKALADAAATSAGQGYKNAGRGKYILTFHPPPLLNLRNLQIILTFYLSGPLPEDPYNLPHASEARRLKRESQREADTICFACRGKGHAARDCPEEVTSAELETEGGGGKKVGKTMVGICYRFVLPPPPPSLLDHRSIEY